MKLGKKYSCQNFASNNNYLRKNDSQETLALSLKKYNWLQGEVTIREAILELEMWAAQSSFALIDYKHSNGQAMKVIKDWKESINSVKDSQALLQSLKSSPFYTQFQDKTGIWETRYQINSEFNF